MVTLNGFDVVDRHNRPNTTQAILLRAFFINDGVYQDPVDISGVTIFDASANFNPSSVLDANNLINTTLVSSVIRMAFGASANDAGAALAETSYSTIDTSSLSGIYRTGVGKYAVVLDGVLDTSGFMTINVDSTADGFEIRNTASTVGDYIDVWTVKLTAGSTYNSIINNFQLKDDSFFTTTQPIIFESRVKMLQKKVTLDSIIDLKAFIDVSVQNRDIDEGIKNLFARTVVTSGAFAITKINESPGLASRVAVSGYADTSGSVDITSDNTLIFNWNTGTLPAIAAADPNNYGGVKGTYEVRVQYSILNQTLISPPLFLTIV